MNLNIWNKKQIETYSMKHDYGNIHAVKISTVGLFCLEVGYSTLGKKNVKK